MWTALTVAAVSSAILICEGLNVDRAAMVCEGCHARPPNYQITTMECVVLCETCVEKISNAIRADQLSRGGETLPRPYDQVPPGERWMGR